MKALLLVFILVGLSIQEEPVYQAIESHYFDYPLMTKDLKVWQSLGASFFHKNKAVIVPEAMDRRGIIFNEEPMKEKAWIAEIEFHIGNEKQLVARGSGIGVMYSRNMDKNAYKESIFGYSLRYDGLGVFLNS